MDHSLTARDAALRILEAARPQPALRVPLDDALGHILAHDARSPLDIPAHTNSAMDGYACRAEDVRGRSPVKLKVVEQIPAGRMPMKTIGPGECARIFTGAALPKGADGVVRQEDTDLGADVVTVLKDRDAGANFRRAGEDLAKGALALPAGTLLGPAELGVLASMAVAAPMVVRRPRVGILGSGDEIATIDEPDGIDGTVTRASDRSARAFAFSVQSQCLSSVSSAGRITPVAALWTTASSGPSAWTSARTRSEETLPRTSVTSAPSPSISREASSAAVSLRR